jgi:hypothetical protein
MENSACRQILREICLYNTHLPIVLADLLLDYLYLPVEWRFHTNGVATNEAVALIFNPTRNMYCPLVVIDEKSNHLLFHFDPYLPL